MSHCQVRLCYGGERYGQVILCYGGEQYGQVILCYGEDQYSCGKVKSYHIMCRFGFGGSGKE